MNAVRVASLDELVERAERLLDAQPAGARALLGVVGTPGSGKTTLATALAAAVTARRGDPGPAAVQLPMDGFHLADVQLERLGLRDAKGAPDTFDADGYATLLQRLRTVEDVTYAPAFDRDLEQPLAGAIAVPASCRLVVTEGNYLLLPEARWAAARAQLDEVWYVTVPEALRTERLLARHVRFGKAPDDAAAWVAAVDEPNARLVEQHRDRADLLLDLDVSLTAR